MSKQLCIALAILFACTASGCQTSQNDSFAIYLVSPEIPTAMLAQADLSRLPLANEPLVAVKDIVSYDSSHHTLELTHDAYARLQEIFPVPIKVSGTPFVVCVGKERIYAGAFWTPLSSLSFDGVVIMQPMDPGATSIHITLGYPAPDVFTGNDPRADSRILQALRQVGKLKP